MAGLDIQKSDMPSVASKATIEAEVQSKMRCSWQLISLLAGGGRQEMQPHAHAATDAFMATIERLAGNITWDAVLARMIVHAGTVGRG